jgi:antitoxin VapB
MNAERRIKIIRNGRDQIVRIPREFELQGEHAIMRKEGNKLIIEPVKKSPLVEWLATLEPLNEEFPEIPELSLDLPPDFG